MQVSNIKLFNTTKAVVVSDKQPKTSSFKSEQHSVSSADPTNAIKSQLGVKTPLRYSHISSFKVNGIHQAEMYKMENGQTVVIVPKKGPTIVRSVFNVGSMNEPDNLRGISHFIEHNLFNGTENIGAGEFFSLVNKMGADTNASTSFAQTDYFISSQLLDSQDLKTKIKLHADMVENPQFADAQLTKERGPVISEISMCKDNPENKAVQKCIKNLFQVKSSSDDLIAGEVKNIENITRKDVVDYFNTWYTPENMVTVVTGDVNPQEVMNLVSTSFSKRSSIQAQNRKYEQLKPIQTTVREDVVALNASGATILMGFIGPQNNNTADNIKFEVILQLLLGSRNSSLNKKLEAIPASVGITQEKISNLQSDPTAMLFTAKSSEENSEKVLKTLYEEIHNLAHFPVSSEALEIAKNRCRKNMDKTLDVSQGINQMISSSFLNGDMNYVTSYNSLLNSITPADISSAAQKYLDLNKVSLSVVHPPKNKNVAFKGSRNVGVDFSAVENRTLSNNIKYAFNQSQLSSNTVTLSLITKYPANVKPGVSALLSEMINRGSQYLSNNQIEDIVDKNCIDRSASAGNDGISYTFNTQSEGLSSALNLMKQAVFSPNLTQENLDFAKKILKESLKQQQNSPLENVLKDFFPNSEKGYTRKELLDNIESITLNDVIGLHQYILQNSKAKVSASAPLSSKQAIDNEFTYNYPVFRPFEVEMQQTYLPATENKIFTTTENQNQAHIVKAYKFKMNGNLKDEAAVNVMNFILGASPSSRLFKDLRETQKLAYRVRSAFSTFGNTGMINLHIMTTTDNPEEGTDKVQNVKKSLDGFDYHVKKIMTEKVSDEELQSAKALLKSRILNETETDFVKTLHIADAQSSPYGIQHLNQFIKEIDNLTVDDIQNAAKYVFSNSSTTSIMASEKTLKEMKL